MEKPEEAPRGVGGEEHDKDDAVAHAIKANDGDGMWKQDRVA